MPFMANRAFSCANATHGSMADTDTEMVDSVAGGSRGLEALRTDRGPSWDGKKTTYATWWYEMYAFLLLCKLGPTLSGANRDEKKSADPKVAESYRMKNLLYY